ncbi:serine/threonine-protein kinase [Streptomyces sp. NPDC051320]|uniref:serine/threonine-protein kinase n=1 Tax=Streptomyces sp. NPDC051320 TaxID=3154644 RepID=UPI00341D0A4E
MPHDAPSRNSRLIAGRYLLGDRIGRGGMGTVWRATDQLLGREVAVKELHPETGAAPASALREARAVAQIKHPHVIVVHDVVVEDERPYIVMELVVGGSLADRLKDHGPVDTREAAGIGIALLGALRAAHARGVLHRDIKPANVLLEDGGRVVVTDFGIARVAGATTISETGAFIGSPEYTSPERMQGGTAGPEADLWSLGALLCAALSGESPFHRDSLGGVLHAVVTEEIRPPAAVGPLLPVVRGLLARDPAQRLTADEAERLLAGYVSTDPAADQEPATVPTQAPVPAPAAAAGESAPLPQPAGVAPPPAPPPRRRFTGRTALVVAVLAVAVAGSAVALAVREDGSSTGKATARHSAPAYEPSKASPRPAPTVTVTRQPAATAGGSGSGGRDARPVSSASGGSDAPAGYRTAGDPGGFSLAVPSDATRWTDGERIYYMTPDKVFRIGIRIHGTPGDGPVAAQQASDTAGPSTNPGYHDGRVTATTHDGHDAALWEFSWNGFSKAEGQRHTYDLCWEQDGHLYDVWVSAPVGSIDTAKRHFDTAVDSFTAAG